jgi:hypothetical protein
VVKVFSKRKKVMPAEVTFTGWKEFRDKIKTLPPRAFEELDGQCEDAAGMWVDLAQRAAPVDQNRLRANIGKKQESIMHWEVTSGSEVSAVMEWGTGSKVDVPADLQAYAAEFKGKPEGGDFKQLIINITAWAKRKGIPAEAVGAIAFSILRNGVRPHPYFFMQAPLVEKALLTNGQAALNRVLNA